MSFQFDNCTFENNTAHTKYYEVLYTDVHGQAQEGYGKGGGVGLFLDSGIHNVQVLFLGCKFFANHAFVGSGLSVHICGKTNQTTNNITVETKSSLFESNGCNHTKYEGFGGGAHLIFDTFLERSGITNSHYLVRNVTFTDNCAKLGGGAYHFSDRDRADSSNDVLFDDCKFKQNKAHLGSAVAMTPNLFFKMSSGYPGIQ